MADRRALVITSPGVIGLQDADELGFTRAGAAADQVLLPAQVVHALSPRVSLVLVGLAGHNVKAGLRIDDVVNNDLLISASFAYTSAAWAEVTALLSAGQLRLSPLITHRFPLEAYEEAYQVLRSTSSSGGSGGASPPELAEPRAAR